MFAILQLWWPVLVLLHLPLVVNTIAVTIFKRISHTYDWELPDDLPQTAGDWLRARANRRPGKPGSTEDLIGLVWRLLLVILIALVWNLHSTATWAWCVILAFTLLQRLGIALLMLPLIYPMTKIAVWISRRSGPGHHESDELAASRAAGNPLILEGRRAVLEIAEWRSHNPTTVSHVNDVLRLAYVPLIVAIGGGLIT